jgi:riboflavin kinase/FMN adenylyltransferase
MEKVIGITEFKLPKTVAALGNFDGIHKGHRVLIDKAKEIAKEKNIESALFAFKTHPSLLFNIKILLT